MKTRPLFTFVFLMIVLAIDARKLTPNTVFSIDLIHRNSSLRPPLGSLSHNHRVSLSSSYYAGKNVQTDVVPNNGDYIMKITVGTPPVEFVAVADTGSDLVWLQCSPCNECINQTDPLFDPTKSSTYHIIPCTSKSCDQTGITNSCQQNNYKYNDNSCTYAIHYGDSTKSEGVLSTETLSFPSSQTNFPSFIFGCGYSQEGNLGPVGDGIVGLGSSPLSLVSQFGPKINYKFSYCLTPKSSGVNSKLNFGLDVTGPKVVSTPYINLDSTTYYTLTLDGITIEDTRIPTTTNIIIDSGTTLTYIPTNLYDSLKTALKSAIPIDTIDDPNHILDPCYKTESLGQGFNPPDMIVHFRGANVVLKPGNIFDTFDDLTCFAMVPTDDIAIFGNVAQVNFEVGYDLQAKQVSFGPRDCTM